MLQSDDHRTHEYRRLYCQSCGHPIDVPIQCADRFCFLCSRIRAAKIRRRLKWILKNLHRRPGYYPTMITLSVKNHKNLALQTKHLISSFRRLRQSRLWGYFVAGGATLVEVKSGVDGWHAHLHIFCYMRWMPYTRLLSAWRKCSGGSGVWITRANETVMMNYVTKYITKTEMSSEDRINSSEVLKHYRLFQRFGDWAQLKIPKLASDAQCDNCGKIGFVYIDYNSNAAGYSNCLPSG